MINPKESSHPGEKMIYQFLDYHIEIIGSILFLAFLGQFWYHNMVIRKNVPSCEELVGNIVYYNHRSNK